MRIAVLRAVLATLVYGGLGAGCVARTTPAAKSNEAVASGPVAKVDGQPIYDDDLLPAIRSQLQQLRTQEYQIKSQALQTLIDRKLLEAAAKKKGMTVEKLLEQEVRSQVSEATDEQVQAAYEANKAALKRPLAEVRDQIRQSLKQSTIQQAQQGYTQILRSQSDVSILLSPPKVEVAPDPARLRGNPNAPVTIVEFSDFQCPYCKSAEPALKQLLTKYDGKVRLSYRDFPLRELHPNAQGAAVAARCAGEQGKFWEYHDQLFLDQTKLDAAALKEHARVVGLDEKRFDSCVASGKFQAPIQEDLDTAVRAGVNGTPGFFINGVALIGAQPASAFEQIIDSELKAAVKNK